ncbi:hypothetical protein FACS1894132_06740 [Clostridia bacterium]|nr:hypothetical protein FACS1894132_06740 [Clostridia bacterium]
MKFPSKETVKMVREQYPQGTRVKLISMSDPYNTALTAGCRGSVSHIDDTATVFVEWDCGSRLGCVYGEDSFRKLTRSELIKEQARAVTKLPDCPNMFSKNEVFEIAVEQGYNEFTDFIFTHSDLYGEFILTGELPAEIDTEETI